MKERKEPKSQKDCKHGWHPSRCAHCWPKWEMKKRKEEDVNQNEPKETKMKIVYEYDGDQVCAHASKEDGFTNTQEWPVGFGDDETQAKRDLLINVASEGGNISEYED